jgi:hypothetical protein
MRRAHPAIEKPEHRIHKEASMPRLCNDCLVLVTFGWSEQPCDHERAGVLTHECDTLSAFGWSESLCPDCRAVGFVAA